MHNRNVKFGTQMVEYLIEFRACLSLGPIKKMLSKIR